jgi:hypothetical protein
MTKPGRVEILECRGVRSYDVGKQVTEGFLATPRGRAYAHRKERRPFAHNFAAGGGISSGFLTGAKAGTPGSYPSTLGTVSWVPASRE